MFICPIIVSIVWFLKMYPKYLQKRFIKLTNVQLPCFVVKVFLMGKIVFWPPNARGALPERDVCDLCRSFLTYTETDPKRTTLVTRSENLFHYLIFTNCFCRYSKWDASQGEWDFNLIFFCLFYRLTFSFPCNVLNSISMLALVPVYVPVFVQLFT